MLKHGVMHIVSQQTGTVAQRSSELADGKARIWQSAIAKRPAPGRTAVNKLGLNGDAQADLVNHGGMDKAICCYPAAHYPAWHVQLERNESTFPFGAFGENWTWDGADENSVCIGDIYSTGSAVVQISQPRGPCWKVGRLWGRASLPGEMVDTGRTGWYLRVLQSGVTAVGDILTLQDRPLPEWSVASVNHAFYRDKSDRALATELAALPLLAEAWRGAFRRRAAL